jgi:septal ring factor EnvC (AmiA/AmiB activator)
VDAPAAGRVAFAGSFRSYGLLLIIDHGDGYHSLLSGMSRLHVGVKQWVRAGEPVASFDDLGEIGPQLYVELRRNGRPVNPLSWLAASDSKVRG